MHCNHLQSRNFGRISAMVYVDYNRGYGTAVRGTHEEFGFCHCSLIISSQVPVSENIKYLLLLADSNCKISPAAICILNSLFRNCIKLGPATMLLASCSRGVL